MNMLTYNKTVKTLAALVKEKGADYVYPPAIKMATCRYLTSKDGAPAPSCIIGHFVARLQPDKLAEMEVAEGTPASEALMHLGYRFDDSKVEWLVNEVQQNQDRAIPWGESLRLAMYAAEHGGATFIQGIDDESELPELPA